MNTTFYLKLANVEMFLFLSHATLFAKIFSFTFVIRINNIFKLNVNINICSVVDECIY